MLLATRCLGKDHGLISVKCSVLSILAVDLSSVCMPGFQELEAATAAAAAAAAPLPVPLLQLQCRAAAVRQLEVDARLDVLRSGSKWHGPLP